MIKDEESLSHFLGRYIIGIESGVDRFRRRLFYVSTPPPVVLPEIDLMTTVSYGNLFDSYIAFNNPHHAKVKVGDIE